MQTLVYVYERLNINVNISSVIIHTYVQYICNLSMNEQLPILKYQCVNSLSFNLYISKHKKIK